MFWILLFLLIVGGMVWYYQIPSRKATQIGTELGIQGELEAIKNPAIKKYPGPYEFQPKPDTYDLRQKIKEAYPDSIITRTATPLMVKLRIHHPDGSVIVADGKDTHDANRVLALKLGVTE